MREVTIHLPKEELAAFGIEHLVSVIRAAGTTSVPSLATSSLIQPR